MQSRARSSASCGRELPEEVDALRDPETHREAFEREALGAVADHHVAQRRMALREHRERTQDVGVALARDQVRDRDERRRDPPRALAPSRARALAALALCEGSSVPRCTTRVSPAPCARASSAMPWLLASTSAAAPRPRATASAPSWLRPAV